ncbi:MULTISPECIES: lysoplasmalogenase [unclassified Brucella]|uniref:lysoplasmalogenase n=1 Tax=unclassified Brucella TaxID=2632610 RepID=UPI000972D613|nr:MULTISPECIES: lysoplasmalogenase [unclassified Brucella]APX67957.1 lysoplasmalogenase [Brucella sp. 09RB8471]MRN43098.1 lysoplasmalogenase [Brucella sp. 09RB8913]MRN60298.1 lysoplasmalogenase [Brucella sp. 09RB8918]MRN77263.1 lysoplasmalogenase [Brucella sp. 10RB9210]CAB4327891.1 Multicopper oxidase, type 1 [Brucella sp. 191011898]
MRHKGLLEFGRNRTFYGLFLFCAVCAIAGSLLSHDGEISLWRWLHYLTKPTATLLLLGAVLCAKRTNSKPYGLAIAFGLAFAALGDFFLMLPGDYFMAGLICFLITHCAYIYALCRDARFGAHKGPFVVFTIVALAIIFGLWTSLPAALKIPVIIYAAALGIMAAQATSRALGTPAETPRRYAAWLAAAGGLFFMVSDTLLAYGRFSLHIPLNAFWVLGTYYAAQFLFARSTEDFANEH